MPDALNVRSFAVDKRKALAAKIAAMYGARAGARGAATGKGGGKGGFSMGNAVGPGPPQRTFPFLQNQQVAQGLGVVNPGHPGDPMTNSLAPGMAAGPEQQQQGQPAPLGQPLEQQGGGGMVGGEPILAPTRQQMPGLTTGTGFYSTGDQLPTRQQPAQTSYLDIIRQMFQGQQAPTYGGGNFGGGRGYA